MVAQRAVIVLIANSHHHHQQGNEGGPAAITNENVKFSVYDVEGGVQTSDPDCVTMIDAFGSVLNILKAADGGVDGAVDSLFHLSKALSGWQKTISYDKTKDIYDKKLFAPTSTRTHRNMQLAVALGLEIAINPDNYTHTPKDLLAAAKQKEGVSKEFIQKLKSELARTRLECVKDHFGYHEFRSFCCFSGHL